jgi:hypothetical protein
MPRRKTVQPEPLERFYLPDGTDVECLSPVKLCHNLIDRGDQNYGSKTVFGRRYFEATARG